ncbi:MAG TPA: hypothetical protein PKZ97_08725 [Azospirillaceae bacterium]|nr:hypothetical protein [Azospirillaceae bacterium]HRQ81190.1 hypothetical protein [Azospirillaceae bacterium]
MNLKLASIAMDSADLQNATQIAYTEVIKPKVGDKARRSAARRIEKAATRLADAAEVLEMLLETNRLSSEAGDDVHEALERIMETQQLVAAAHARLRREAAPQ